MTFLSRHYPEAFAISEGDEKTSSGRKSHKTKWDLLLSKTKLDWAVSDEMEWGGEEGRQKREVAILRTGCTCMEIIFRAKLFSGFVPPSQPGAAVFSILVTPDASYQSIHLNQRPPFLAAPP